ncbi:flagellar biosynthetic protein FliO [Oleiphilus messinensis]|uniref:flagellar biosynthetic protein FliO n=1 Tax=Oleiphilus messinensis TaxID=141451 RepID=UPI0012FB2226|nr:flagellar biosynthetic protein FliO [Oleiphilus messinensis]
MSQKWISTRNPAFVVTAFDTSARSGLSNLFRCAVPQFLGVISLLFLFPRFTFAAETPSASSPEPQIFTSVFVPVALTLLLAALAVWMIKWRVRQKADQGPLKLIQNVPLGAKERVFVAEYNQAQILIAVSSSGIQIVPESSISSVAADLKAKDSFSSDLTVTNWKAAYEHKTSSVLK